MNLKIDHDSATPLHKQAEDLLRELIAQEKYRNGALLPKEVELSEKLNISRNTLRQAINKLVHEGLLQRKKGVGTKVARKSMFIGAQNWMSFTEEMKSIGIREVQNFEMHITWKTLNEEGCRFFEIEPKTKVLCLERLRGKKDFPFVYFISWFNPKIPILGNENFNRRLYEILGTDYGIHVKTSKEEISADLAGAKLAEKLDIRQEDPILIRKRFVYDVHGMPVEYNIGYYRADSFTYTIESVR